MNFIFTPLSDGQHTGGRQLLVSNISRCPFLLSRIIKVTAEGRVIYRAGKSQCLRFPNTGDERLWEGASHNFQVFDALQFPAEVTQHIPDKGQHLIHYFGWYSNKERGVRKNRKNKYPIHMRTRLCFKKPKN